MSMNLYWEPVVDRGQSLSDSLKFILRDDVENCLPCTMSESSLPFLRGIRAAGNAELKKDCTTLIEAIEKHGTVRLWQE